MSEPLRDLKNEIHEFDFTADGGGAKAESILNLLESALSQDEAELRKRAPPLDVLVYALKSILFPSLLPELISEFLHLFTMVEFYRIRATQKAAEALEFNDFYRRAQSHEGPLLAESEEHYFSDVVNSQSTMRKLFIRVVKDCCFIDLKKLWLAESNTEFWIRWNEYLSVLRKPEDRKIPFQYKLSAEEIADLRGAVVDFSHFMAGTTQLVKKQREQGHSDQDIFNTKALLEDLPVPEITSGLNRAINYHLSYVQEVVKKLKLRDTLL